MKKVSIIIPVYNSEKFLKKCVDSVLNQTYTNLEIILVDDGSLDSSGKICDEYARSDERIQVIHQNNLGVSSARNNALNIFTGDYVSFVDSDDWVDCDYIKQLVCAIQKYDCDFAYCDFVRVYDTDAYTFKKEVDKTEVLDVRQNLFTTKAHHYTWGGY